MKLVVGQGYKISEAARSLGVHQSLLYHWKKGLKVKNHPSHNSLSDILSHNNQLKAANNRLYQEREILKKATVFFAKNLTVVPNRLSEAIAN